MQIERKKKTKHQPRHSGTIEARREVLKYLASCGGVISSVQAGLVSREVLGHLGWPDVSRVNNLIEGMVKDKLVETVRTERKEDEDEQEQEGGKKKKKRRYYYEIRLPGMPAQVRYENGKAVRVDSGQVQVVQPELPELPAQPEPPVQPPEPTHTGMSLNEALKISEALSLVYEDNKRLREENKELWAEIERMEERIAYLENKRQEPALNGTHTRNLKEILAGTQVDE